MSATYKLHKNHCPCGRRRIITCWRVTPGAYAESFDNHCHQVQVARCASRLQLQRTDAIPVFFLLHLVLVFLSFFLSFPSVCVCISVSLVAFSRTQCLHKKAFKLQIKVMPGYNLCYSVECKDFSYFFVNKKLSSSVLIFVSGCGER